MGSECLVFSFNFPRMRIQGLVSCQKLFIDEKLFRALERIQWSWRAEFIRGS